MAFRVRVNCYVCDRVYQPGQMARIDGNNNPDRQNIAIFRRLQLRRPPLEVADESRLCLNCNQSIRNEIEELQRDPGCLRLNVLTQTGRQTCMFCNADVNTPRLSIECRVNAFIVMDIFIPEETRACLNHLDEHGFILGPLLPGLQAINRPYRIPGQQLLLFLQQLRNEANVHAAAAFNNEDSFTDEEFEAIAPVTKEQFRELYAFCDPIPQLHGHGARYVRKKDLLTFLCKMRQGLSDEFLKVIFHYSSRQATSMAISTVRESLMQRFVPGNIGFNAISREEFIERHVTSFANELYNPQPEIPRAIAIIDGTYAYMQKSSNFRVLRQSFCKHKGRHLVKPALIVAPDGYILEIQGPYFSDSRNNDAQMLINEFERDVEGMREFFDIGDIFIEDRGYRDAQPLLERLGIVSKIPPFLQQGQSQLVTEEANEARLITKSRWIVESRNGHIKSIFKFFEKTIPMAHVHNLRDFFRIAGAIINRYHPVIEMQGATAELAREYIARAREPNIVQARVEVDNMRYGNANWNRLHELQVPQFPRLTLEEIRDITIGVYQVELAPSYVQDKLQREEDEEFQLDTRLNEPGLIRVRVFSRFRNATRYQLWIAFNEIDDIGPDNNETLLGYYCTCKSGARTLGTCAHIASVLWFLGYARHQQHVKYPQTSLLQRILDAANRGEQANPNQEPEIV